MLGCTLQASKLVVEECVHELGDLVEIAQQRGRECAQLVGWQIDRTQAMTAKLVTVELIRRSISDRKMGEMFRQDGLDCWDDTLVVY